MTLSQLIPAIQALSREDKLRLLKTLAQDLQKELEVQGLLSEGEYPVWSPHGAHAAAETLLNLLEESAPERG